MKDRKTSGLIFIIFLFLLTACQGKQQATSTTLPVATSASTLQGSYTDITVAELQDMLANKDFTFVNVHVPFEGDIAGTDLSIPYDQIEKNLDSLPADKEAKIVLYCRSGRMSSIAAEKLAGLSYTNVYNLQGGMVAWEQAKLPIER